MQDIYKKSCKGVCPRSPWFQRLDSILLFELGSVPSITCGLPEALLIGHSLYTLIGISLFT